MIEAIFYDWGGVLADDPGEGFLSQLLRDNGAGADQVEAIYNGYMRSFMRGEISEARYWELLRTDYGLTIHPSISEEFKRWNGLEVNRRVLRQAIELRQRGLRTAILSNVIEPTYKALVSTGYFDNFDAVIASCQVGFAKPQPEIYQLALQQLNVAAEQALFIDDKPRNLEPAGRLGFHTILAQNPQQIIDDLDAALAGRQR